MAIFLGIESLLLLKALLGIEVDENILFALALEIILLVLFFEVQQDVDLLFGGSIYLIASILWFCCCEGSTLAVGPVFEVSGFLRAFFVLLLGREPQNVGFHGDIFPVKHRIELEEQLLYLHK